MAAGSLDRRITILRATTAANAYNEIVETWGPLTTVWCEVTPVSDGERWRAQEVGASVTHRFRVRWSPTVASVGPLDRVAFEGREFNILGVKEIQRRVGLEITATARGE